jgi:hypothetical protein
MSLLDLFRKKKPALSVLFTSKAASLSILVSVKGQAAVGKINTFVELFGSDISSLSKHPAMATESANLLVAKLDSEFFSDPGIKEKMAELNVASETKADKAFFSSLNKVLATARSQALLIPKMFENPISFQKKTGLAAFQGVADKIKDIIELLSVVEKSFIKAGE